MHCISNIETRKFFQNNSPMNQIEIKIYPTVTKLSISDFVLTVITQATTVGTPKAPR